jgi:hypothetical protein
MAPAPAGQLNARSGAFRFISQESRMKVGQKTIVRWVSKRFAKVSEPAAPRSSAGLAELSIQQLRHVAGGTDSPNRTW